MSEHFSSVLPDVVARAVATRRDLHRFPELGMIEFRTASIVAERLTALGLDVKLGREVMDSASRMGLPSEAALDLTVEIELAGRTTVAASDEVLSRRLARSLSGHLPGVEIDAGTHVTGGSEDATYFMRRVQERGGQAIYAVVGSDIPSGHHTPEFDIDEKDFPWAIEALATGILALARENEGAR